MKQSAIHYILALFILIIALLWTSAMIYMYLYKGLTVLSVPFFMLSIFPVLGYSLSVWIITLACEYSKLEKLYSRRY